MKSLVVSQDQQSGDEDDSDHLRNVFFFRKENTPIRGFHHKGKPNDHSIEARDSCWK